ncbi:glycerol-3-phosphate responsive antiterminator [Fodinisporobacter ferrooxydans]|uniref:Glycerol uptake operon antiterminator regulatory protein n=1 Tax=Fodinisporobacter ferrooxydans TaxID=2901836 RepID=A0ABY4CH67_9BACL|nr:glycerol-3-phosphate responsive antiterminator [Alicyclobacillaceae bacterium MYW30-H2]
MKEDFRSLFKDNPIVAGIKDDTGLENVLQSSCDIVFVLYGDICNIGTIVDRVKSAGKYAFVDVDLVKGTSSKEIVVDFIKQVTKADGIISTKGPIIKAAKAQGFFTIHRFFLVDSFSFHSLPKQIETSIPDCIEILPGCMPKVISWVRDIVNVPIIAGGLVCEKDDVVAALKAGAVSICSTSTDIWDNV